MSRGTHAWNMAREMEVRVQLHLNSNVYIMLLLSRAMPHLSGHSFRGMSRSNRGEDVFADVLPVESARKAYDMIGWELEYSFYRVDMLTLLDALSGSARVPFSASCRISSDSRCSIWPSSRIGHDVEDRSSDC